jgi:hypothetical protein
MRAPSVSASDDSEQSSSLEELIHDSNALGSDSGNRVSRRLMCKRSVVATADSLVDQSSSLEQLTYDSSELGAGCGKVPRGLMRKRSVAATADFARRPELVAEGADP